MGAVALSLSMTEEQIKNMCRSVVCPVLVL
jgi:hypothetical protein